MRNQGLPSLMHMFKAHNQILLEATNLQTTHPKVSWTQSTTSSLQSSKSKIPQVNPVTRPARDPEKQGARAQTSGDQGARDPTRSQSPDIPRDPSRVLTRDKSRDPIRFGRARSPLINRWQTVGTVNNQRNHVILVLG
jgi:hypothetical protein